MIQLNSRDLQPSSVAHLNAVQQQILNEPTFEAQARKAKAKWDNKTSGAGQTAFQDVKAKLKDMCAGIEICVYCEQNEATDIEHIFPKKLYPEKAFDWNNYVSACGKCNTHHKSDNFKIFNPLQSAIEENITPARGTFIKPANEDALFINQRTENPMDFLELDLVNQLFIFTEKYPVGTREYLKARYTTELLALNSRDDLVQQRKNAVTFYISNLEKYVKVKAAASFQELKEALDDFVNVDETVSLATEKHKILDAIKNDMSKHVHPTVWKEMIRQRDFLNKTNYLLNQAPEALTW